MNIYQLFRRSRLRLAFWYASVMAIILSLSGFSMYRFLVQSNWRAMEQEMEAIAGTLHDSLEPMLPVSQDPTTVLRQILPELCLTGKPCNVSTTLIQRHTTGISDRNIFYIRLYDRFGNLIAFSPNQPLPLTSVLNPDRWQTFQNGDSLQDAYRRYHQFTIILHHSADHDHLTQKQSNRNSWGYLQIGRNLTAFDADDKRMQFILAIGFPMILLVVAISSWWLSKLAMQPIYQSYQQQQQFTANAAHELRSPLASLLATVEAILRMPSLSSQDTNAMLHIVERQGRRLSQLISDLLFLTGIEQNSSPKSFQLCCLNDLIADLTEEFLELASTANIHLSHQVPDFEIYVWGNESQLYRLVANLIANAIQYTTSDGDVAISLTSQDYTALITVKDTGIGIAESEQSRIFERFYRVDGDRSRKTGGTGLGLAIAMAIAHHHQGHLTVKSSQSQGSLFMVHLPCDQP